jgi:hypothetical protein
VLSYEISPHVVARTLKVKQLPHTAGAEADELFKQCQILDGSQLPDVPLHIRF